MKNKDLIEQLQKLDSDLDVYIYNSGSSCSHEIDCVYERSVEDSDDMGILCYVERGTQIITISLEH